MLKTARAGNRASETAARENSPGGRNTSARLDGPPRDTRRFRWSREAVRRLDEEVEWALTSNPTGAAEVAGVLLGKKGFTTTEVTDCQTVFLMQPGDHEYALSGPGRREFDRTIAAFKSNPDNGVSVVGLYRSHIGEHFDLLAEDLGLIRTCFRNTSQLVLLMKLTEDGSCRAKLFSGDDGRLLSQFHSAEEPSRLPRWLKLWQHLSAEYFSYIAGPEDRRESRHTTEPQPRAGSHAPLRPAEDAQPESVGPKRRSSRILLLLFAAAIVLAAFVAYPMFERSATVNNALAAFEAQHDGSRSSDLGLRVKRNGDDLRLDWNRNAPVLGKATGGMLSIRDGNAQERPVMLDLNLLRTGAVIYQPVHDDVVFRLVIFGQNGSSLGEAVTTYVGPISATRSHPQKESK